MKNYKIIKTFSFYINEAEFFEILATGKINPGKGNPEKEETGNINIANGLNIFLRD